MVEVEHVLSSQCELGEGPLWHPTEQALYWLDIYAGFLHHFDPHTYMHEVTDLGLMTSAMGLRAQGGMVMATGKGFATWDGQHFKFLSDPDADGSPNTRFNDGKTDRQGRFWAGKMGDHADHSLYCLDADCSIHRMVSGISISNGLGWSPDNRLFYFTDTPTRAIVVYDFDAESGALSNRRIFARVPNAPGEGFPDGLAVDADGYVWSARWGGWKVVRYAPDGSVDREVRLPVELVTSCAFGGPHLTDLYITSAWTDVPAERRAAQPLAGDIFRLKTDTPGLPEPFFLG